MWSLMEQIGYMFQRDHLLDWRTIMDNITIGLEILKRKDKLRLIELRDF